MTPILPYNSENRLMAASLLKQGQIIAHPADTCYGLAAKLGDEAALRKLQALKGRDALKPMSIMIHPDEMASLEEYIYVDKHTGKVCKALYPGSCTMLHKKGLRIPRWYFPETDLIGLRIVDDARMNELLKALGGPIITTSANLSGEKVCTKAEDIAKSFEGSDDLALILQGPEPLTQIPSTVMKLEGDRLKILRQGRVSAQDILEKLEWLDIYIG